MSQSQIDLLEGIIEAFRNAIEERKQKNLPQEDIEWFESKLLEVENELKIMKDNER